MRAKPLITLAVVLAMPVLLAGQQKAAKPHNAIDHIKQVVKDQNTAVAVAEAVLIPIYGEQSIARQRPLKASLKDEVWHVRGTLPRDVLGGVAEIWLSAKDCRVIRITHGK